MPYTSEKLKNSQVKFTITITPTEYQPSLEKAAVRLSERTAIKGFRKGKAPFDIVKKELGEMMILQEALEGLVQDAYVAAIKKEELEVIGMPEIHIEKLAPGNDIVFSATVALIPNVELPNISSISVTKNKKTVDDTMLQETVDALRGMHAVEVLKEGSAEGTDKLVIDMDMFMDKVPVEGGQAKNYQVYLSEDHYIPGFNAHVSGMKKGDQKEFSLDFPKTHYQKQLAGKTVDFNVAVKEVYQRQLPELNDEFAKKLGQASVEELKKLILSNLQNEAEHKAEQQLEIDLLDTLIEKTKFADIPEVLITAERHKIFNELKHNLEKSGVTIDQYLGDIKKKQDELFNDFTEQATKRAKAALISRAITKQQQLQATEEEIEKEVDLIRGMYKDNKDAMENLKRPDVRDSIAVMIQNRKVMGWLKEQITVKEEAIKPKKKEKK